METKEHYNCFTDDCFDCPEYENCHEQIEQDNECLHFDKLEDYEDYEDYENEEYDYSDELMDQEFEDKISMEY